MRAASHFEFTRRPSDAGLLVHALRNSLPRVRPVAKALAMRATWSGVCIERAHLQAFNAACHVRAPEAVPILYPMTLVYPPLLRLLSSGAAPMPLFFALNTKLSVRQSLALAAGDRLDIDLAAAHVRQVDKGLELDVQASVRRGEEPVWDSVLTFYYRGRFDAVDRAAPSDALPEIASAGAQHDWVIPAKGGFRFGRLCGDTNPLHYGKAYAKAFGFERDFAQPLLVLGQALSRLAGPQPGLPARLDARLKAPVYYEHQLKMLVAQTPHGRRFDIYCVPNSRPSICALWDEPRPAA